MAVQTSFALPAGFVYLRDIDSSIEQDIKYYSDDNFVGRPIKGYDAAECILTRETAEALAKVQKLLLQQSLRLKVYDCYRPQAAVNDFIAWSQDKHDQKQKKLYYPNINKADFFKLGYVAAKSGHSRGTTVDLTITQDNPHHQSVELFMGTHFDFMDPSSHVFSKEINTKAQKNRMYLRSLMIDAGFDPLEEEWWHFTLHKEPYPYTYFNFPVK